MVVGKSKKVVLSPIGSEEIAGTEAAAQDRDARVSLRQEIRVAVSAQALEIVRGAIEKAVAGQLAQMKYLFAMIGLYPVVETADGPGDESLIRLLLRGLGLFEQPADGKSATKHQEQDAGRPTVACPDPEPLKSSSAALMRGETDASMDMTWLTERIAVGGGIWREENMIEVCRLGITHIINMQMEFDDTTLAEPYGVEVLWNATDDDFEPKHAALFERGVSFATNALGQAGSKVYIHCAAGVHRAPMMALALLCTQGWNLPDAMELIESKRPAADFPDVYVESVRSYLDQITSPHGKRKIWSQ
jgi:protein-tyrosine phosphatase